MQELWFLHFTHRLMLIKIHRKFREGIERFSSYREDTFFKMDKVPKEIIQKL